MKVQQGSVTTPRLERENEFRRRPRPKGELYCIGVIVFLRLSLCLFRHSTHFSSAVAAVALLPYSRSFPLRLSLPGTEIESGPAAKFTMTLLPSAVKWRARSWEGRAALLLRSALPLSFVASLLLSRMSDQFGSRFFGCFRLN